MIQRGYRTQESQIRHTAGKALELCRLIDDSSLQEFVPPIQEALQILAADRRVLVVGDKGSGKSSLVAALAECPFIAKTEMEGVYTRWRYSSRDGEHSASRFTANERMEGLEIVDTRDCAGIEARDSIAKLLRAADAIIATLDARKAEDAAVWKVLSQLPGEAKEKTIIALTFVDTMSAAESLEPGARVQALCKEKLGAPLGYYVCNPCSTTSMEAFAAQVQKLLDAPHGVRGDIRLLKQRVGNLVDKQWSILNARDAVARTDVGFMTNIEHEIDNFLSRQLLGVPGMVDSYSATALRVVPMLQQRLRRTLGWWLSPVTLLRLEQLAAGTEKCLYNMFCEEIHRVQSDSDNLFVISCEGHWKSVRPRMEKTLACEIGEFPQSTLREQLDNLRGTLCRDLHEPFLQLKLRYELGKKFNSPADWMHRCIRFICYFLALAGILGFIGQDIPALYCVGIALLIWLGGSLAHVLFVRRVLEEVGTCTGMLSAGLKASLAERAKIFIISRVTAYRVLYIKPRETVARHEKMLRPLKEMHESVRILLKDAAPRI